MERDDVRVTLTYDLIRLNQNPDRYAIDLLKAARNTIDTALLQADGFNSKSIRDSYERQFGRALSSLNRALGILEKQEDRYYENKSRRREMQSDIEPTVKGLRLEDVTDEYICRVLTLIEDATERYGNELWLGPFLKNLVNVEFEDFDNASRKVIISEKERRELISIDERQGDRPDETFSVLIPNKDKIAEYERELDERSISDNADSEEPPVTDAH